ncbi:MAG: cobalamin-binding protein [Clostridia bacterium]|nr:cobalamin-binding protein [Clostridia bacterium]
MEILSEISQFVQKGRIKNVTAQVSQALADGIAPAVILSDGLLDGMAEVGEKFKKNEIYVPEVMIAARAMTAGIDLLKPVMNDGDAKAKGKAVLGTVKGDLHSIGKNLVKIMFEGKGIEVIDLGVDVPAEKFVDVAVQEGAGIIACSALLTTTMPMMEKVVQIAEERGVRDKIKIMIGGAPVSQGFCDEIGADCYTDDAASASSAALEYLEALAS